MSKQIVVKFFVKAVTDFGPTPVGYIPDGGATWSDEEAEKLGFVPCEGQPVGQLSQKWPDLVRFLRDIGQDKNLDMRAEFLVAHLPEEVPA